MKKRMFSEVARVSACAIAMVGVGAALLARCVTTDGGGRGPASTGRAVAAAWSGCELPTFPGAYGFGSCTQGPRGHEPDVYYVTNLNASGPGSLQYGIDTAHNTDASVGPLRHGRYILFKVSGVINSVIHVNRQNVYIAGQTSPHGITVRGIRTDMDSCTPGCDLHNNPHDLCASGCLERADNLVIRHLRSRPSFTGAADSAGNEGDDGLRLIELRDAMIDHVSIGNGDDEALQITRASNVTVQHSLLAETMTRDHENQFGGILFNYSSDELPLNNISILRNTLNRIAGRLPELAMETPGLANRTMDVEVSNNLYWDPAYHMDYGKTAWPSTDPVYFNFNYIGNLYYTRPTPPPGTPSSAWTGPRRNATYFSHGMVRADEGSRWNGATPPGSCALDAGTRSRLFFQNNRTTAYPTLQDYGLSRCDCNDFFLLDLDASVAPDPHDCGERLPFGYPIPFGGYMNPAPGSGQDGMIDYMVKYVGAFPRYRDPMDRRLAGHMISRTFDPTPRDNWFTSSTNEAIHPYEYDAAVDSGADAGMVRVNWEEHGIHQDALLSNCREPNGATSSAPTDTDADGMPDAWESTNGTNPAVADAHVVLGGQSYPNIERYLNARADEIESPSFTPPACNTALIRNPNFEGAVIRQTGTDSDVPEGWGAAGVGWSTHQVQVTSNGAEQRNNIDGSSPAVGGGKSARLICRSRFPDGGQVALDQFVTGLAAGATYTARTYYRIPMPRDPSSDGNYRPGVELAILNTAGAVFARSGFNGPTERSTTVNPWHEQKVTFTVPAGASSVILRNYVDCPPIGALGWTGSDLSVLVDDWSLTREPNGSYLHDPGFELPSFDGAPTENGNWYVPSPPPAVQILRTSTAARSGRLGVYMIVPQGTPTPTAPFAIEQRIRVPAVGTYAFSSNVLTSRATGEHFPGRVTVTNNATSTAYTSGDLVTYGQWSTATVVFNTTAPDQLVTLRLEMRMLPTGDNAAVFFDNTSLTPLPSTYTPASSATTANLLPDGDLEDNDLGTFANVGTNPGTPTSNIIYTSGNGGPLAAPEYSGQGLTLHCGTISPGVVIASSARVTLAGSGTQTYRIGFSARASAANAPAVQLEVFSVAGVPVAPASGATTTTTNTRWTRLSGTYTLNGGQTYVVRAALPCNGSVSAVPVYVDNWELARTSP